jgi:hypothetical protein
MAVVVAAIFYIVAGALHFIKPAPYLRIMPPYVPWHIPDMFKKYRDLSVVLRHLASQLLIGRKQLTQPHERSHDADVHLDCALAAQDT